MYSFLEPEVLNGRLEQEILICQWFRTIVHKMFRVHGTNVFLRDLTPYICCFQKEMYCHTICKEPA